jgi:hypothetical protein
MVCQEVDHNARAHVLHVHVVEELGVEVIVDDEKFSGRESNNCLQVAVKLVRVSWLVGASNFPAPAS